MKKSEIHKKYTDFIEEYKEYFPKKDKKILPEILNKETLEKLSVLDLQNICKDKNIPFMSKDKKQILIEKIINYKEDETNDDKTINLEKQTKEYLQNICKEKHISFKGNDKKKILIENIINKEDETNDDKTINLEKQTKEYLQNICKDKNISFLKRDAKKILIEKINEKVV